MFGDDGTILFASKTVNKYLGLTQVRKGRGCVELYVRVCACVSNSDWCVHMPVGEGVAWCGCGVGVFMCACDVCLMSARCARMYIHVHVYIHIHTYICIFAMYIHIYMYTYYCTYVYASFRCVLHVHLHFKHSFISTPVSSPPLPSFLSPPLHSLPSPSFSPFPYLLSPPLPPLPSLSRPSA